MKRVVFIFGVLIFGQLRADYFAEPVEDAALQPFCYTGRVATGSVSGSGVVVSSDHTVVTAAHMLYDVDRKRWRDQIVWWIRNDPSMEKEMRSFRYFTSYADAVDLDGVNSRRAFSQDFGIGIGYESMSDVGHADVSGDPVAAIGSNQYKQAVGFPSGLYESGDPLASRMHKTGPFPEAFVYEFNDYYIISGVATGQGASGGGIWVLQDTQWYLSGLVVSGSLVAEGDSVNSTGMVVLGSEKLDLIDEAVDLASRIGVPVVTSQPPAFILGDWSGETRINVPYFSVPETWVRWEYADPREDPLVFIDILTREHVHSIRYEHDESNSTLIVPEGSSFWNNKVFRVRLENTIGTGYSEAVHFKYPAAVPLSFSDQPESLELSGNAEASFSAAVEGFPPAVYEWEIDLLGKSGWQPLGQVSGDYSWVNTNVLTIPAQGGYFSGSVFRLKADNGNELLYSDPVTLQYQDLGSIQLRVESPPPEVIQLGETITIKIVNTTTMEGALQWKIFDAFGDLLYNLPPNWTIDPSLESITVENDGISVHGYSIKTEYYGKYYREGSNQPQRESLFMEGPSFTLSAEGLAELYETLDYRYDREHGLLTLEAAWDALETPLIEWQVSVDGGSRWHPWATTQGTPLVHQASDLLRSGALFRAKVSREGIGVHTTSPLNMISEGQLVLNRDEVQVIPLSRGGYGAALYQDCILAHGDFPKNDNTSMVRIYERSGTKWTLTGEILLEHMDSPGSGQLEFLNDHCLLVSLPPYSLADIPQCGAVLQVVKGPDGTWKVDRMITAPDPREGGFLGEDFSIHGDTMVISERGRDPPTRILLYRLQDGEFVWEQNLDLSSLGPHAPQGNEVALKGDWLMYGTTNVTYTFHKEEDGTWGYQGYIENFSQNSLPFLFPDGQVLLYRGGSPYESGLVDQWVPDAENGIRWIAGHNCSFGIRLENKDIFLADANDELCGIRTRTEAEDYESGNIVLFKLDETDGSLAATGVSSLDPYEVLGFDLSETSLALLVRDTRIAWGNYLGWEFWVVPLDTVKPVSKPQFFPKLKWQSVNEPLGEIKLRYRQSVVPEIPVVIERSPDLLDWIEVPNESTTVIEDADGDGKVSVQELILRLPHLRLPAYFRALEN